MKQFINLSLLLLVATAALAQPGPSKNTKTLNVRICTQTGGHPVKPGCSGFNARLGDKVWSYKHPDFVEAVRTMRPGWLRYWSGTAGDTFSAATGQYDQEYIAMFDKGESYGNLYRFVEVKGPQRLTDLYRLMGSVGAGVVVTVNAFTETPEMIAELARFCKNNHIRVEAWQFCNEPYFYVPGRQRYWWNNGFDYAQKMKPHADSILKVWPDARLALNFTWDGIWAFMKEINQYQRERGAYWNTFSKHSYAPHIGGEQTFEQAYKRMNTKLPEVTGPEAMAEIERWTQKDIPMLITEFGVWNKPLDGIMAAVYNAEYTLRQLEHPNTWLIGSHEISNKAKPAKNLNGQIVKAFEQKKSLRSTELLTGIELTDEGKALKILHNATNNSDYVWKTEYSGGATVDGMDGKQADGVYALAFRGTNRSDYLALCNRSDQWHRVQITLDGKALQRPLARTWISAEMAQSPASEIQEDKVKSGKDVLLPPFSSMLLHWDKQEQRPPQTSRIFNLENRADGIFAEWQPRPEATGYQLNILDKTTNKTQSVTLDGSENNHFLFKGATRGGNFVFSVEALNKTGESAPSEALTQQYILPGQPRIFKLAPRDTELSVFWNSVPWAQGYRVLVQSADGSFKKTYEADNVFGFKVYDLPVDKPLTVSILAYNGLGEGLASEPAAFMCRNNTPLPPSNISAIEDESGTIQLKWVAPKQPDLTGVLYRIYRGEQLHRFSVLKEGLSQTEWQDEQAEPGREYFYTVKAYTAAGGECNFYPNIATIIRRSSKIGLQVADIATTETGYTITVQFQNIATDGESEFGVSLSDVSYLNGEEIKFKSEKVDKSAYKVDIPRQALKRKANYAVKAYVKTNGGTPVTSLPPLKEFRVE